MQRGAGSGQVPRLRDGARRAAPRRHPVERRSDIERRTDVAHPAGHRWMSDCTVTATPALPVRCPLCPDKPTSSTRWVMSEMCQTRTTPRGIRTSLRHHKVKLLSGLQRSPQAPAARESVVDQSRRFGRWPMTSGLPPGTGHRQGRPVCLNSATRRILPANQLKSLRSFLRISLRSSAYSSMIRRASSVREGLLGGLGPEFVLSSCGIIERSLLSIGSPPATRNAALRG